MSKFCLIALLAFTTINFTKAYGAVPPYNSKPCPKPCNFAFRCFPFFKQPIYSIVDGQCRVWQNSCYFGNENCNRRNQCQDELIQTTQEECLKHCPQFCPELFKPVCATFPVTKEDGENTFRSDTFTNTCFLNGYVCRNSDPYLGGPTDGACVKPIETEG